MSDNMKELADGRLQKLFHDTFAKTLSKVLRQLIGSILNYVQTWAPCNFVLAVPLENTEACITTDLEAAKVLRFWQTRRHLQKDKTKLFRMYITTRVGNIHDCHKAESDVSIGSIRMLGDVNKYVENVDSNSSDDETIERHAW